MTASHSIALNYNSAAPVKTDLIFKTGDKGITFNFAIKGLDTTGMTAKIAFNRSNATSVEAALTGSGEAWTYTTLGNEFAIPGVVVADVKFYNNDETQRVSTASFILGVIGDTLDGLGGGTAGYSDELEVLRAEMEEAADTLEAYIEAYGDRGPLNPRGDYDSDEEYTVCDVVYHNNTSWINRFPCSGEEPTTSSAYWQKMIDAASGGAQELNDLDDVNVSSPTDGQAMIYDGVDQVWKNQAIPTGSATLAGLTDVDVTGVQNGQIVKYNSTTQKWEAANESGGGGASDLDDLSDVDLSSPTNGQVLTFNSVTNKWENQTNTAAGFKPYIITTAATGATVTYSKGGTSITATEVSAGTFRADITDYGTWTVTATLNGQTATTTVNITSVGEYTASATFFSATIAVTFWPSDATVICTDGVTTLTKPAGSASPYTFTVPNSGNWSVVVRDTTTDLTSSSGAISITTQGQAESTTVQLYGIHLSYAAEFGGLSLSLSSGGTSRTITLPALLTAEEFCVNTPATWTLSVTYNGQTYSTTATTTTAGSYVNASLQIAQNVALAFHYSEADSDPDSVTYPAGYYNSSFTTPFSMNLSTGVPNYGDWDFTNENLSWLLPKPCMLKYDGTVDYYLDSSDYTKKADGVTASDVANSAYGGNAMMEWGQDDKMLFWKIVPDAGGTGFTFVVANYKADNDMEAWNHYNCDLNFADHFYTPIYFGGDDGSKMRSISGLSNYVNHTATQEITAAKANNQTAKEIWNTEVYVDWLLISLLCVLISKSTDSQTKFGYGYANKNNPAVIAPGTMNDKGLFYGESTGNFGVKIFGMENFYGNLWRRIAGLINDNGTVKIKLTYGTQDGSSVSGYNETGNGYISHGTMGGTGGGYISHMNITNRGITPETMSGSDSTYYCDSGFFNNSQVDYAFVGGERDRGLAAGIFCCRLQNPATLSNASYGAALSCKPIA